MLCWMNGEYQEAAELTISPFDHGFLYGVGFFETFRTYEEHVFLFREHMERLRAALTEFRISMPYGDREILDAVRRLDRDAGDGDGYFRLNVSAGVHDIGLAPSAYETPNVILFRKALSPAVRGTEKQGVWLETPRNRPESDIRQKSHNFLNNVRGRLELPSLKDQEGLFLTADGHVAEGVTSNVFWMKGGELFTPAIETGILPGTTRAFLLRLAEVSDIRVNEGFYPKVTVEAADEVFVSNAVQEIVPLSSVGGIPFPGVSGVYYKRLHDAYVQAIDEMKESGLEWS
ncbi:branched-chain amino acid aminotransferase/4-amino-4-deoxychorismate lyase [Bacillus sp. OxB-1]|uniref:aminodeoxychorismate lyase n=1 Tax=Bacillus sp. (strain OxB-1) TaxID=98228 RepID=UPI000581E02E|nr:aminodeoxychorismate lyase [Bacillus sp. OxB-1]BAQ09520.1 branched-chain amino acid aminotransferase/4-amino-4-deoxychorismate lyase [Bacillus sp. OxB-1]